ncbi:MAG: asparaginase domain-containing protein [Solirubrobacteraceae bacterium]
MREVTVLAAGGTISSVQGASGAPGASPTLDAAALVAGLPAALTVEARSLRSVSGPQLTNDDALALASAAVAETERGRGVVLTSGTDTIEEVAMLCDVLVGDGPPIVVTGAIRPADAPGADGPANLLDAVVAAASPVTEGAGGLVCFAGELHAARTVRKIDSTAPHAFASPRSGPIARVVEGRIDVFAKPLRGPRVPMPETLEFWTPIVTTWLGDDGSLLRATVNTEPDGLVLVGLGAGHLPPRALAALRECGPALPVVFVVRPERGHLLRETYGYEGSERDVLATGVIEAGNLSGPAARMLLLAGLGAGLRGEDLRAVFAVGP